MIQLQLAIPEPCHENWDQMTTNEQGKFCNSCAKTVIDFSAMTDAQLMNYFQQLKNENVCGRMHEDQLQRTMVSLPEPRKKIFRYWQFTAAFFIMLFKGPQAKAQTGMISFLKIKTERPLQRILDQKITLAKPVKHVTVVDADAQPIAGASVRLLYGGNILFTDTAGTISFKKEDETETLIITAVGYKEKKILEKDILLGKVWMEKDIRSLENVTVESNSKLTRRVMVGGGIGYTVKSTSIIKDSMYKIINFIDPSISAYPNPVAGGGIVNLSLKIKKAGTYRFHIYDASGKLMLAQNHTVPEKTFAQPINIPSTWSHGIYFISVVAVDGKNIGKVKIAVQ